VTYSSGRAPLNSLLSRYGSVVTINSICKSATVGHLSAAFPYQQCSVVYATSDDINEHGAVQYDTTDDDPIAETGKQAAARRRAERVDSILAETWSRGKWLLGLLVLQSMSSVVLDNYQDLIREHLVITLFLTMLVGAGGNAGNQSAIKACHVTVTASAPESI
jgi:hypothetical protein